MKSTFKYIILLFILAFMQASCSDNTDVAVTNDKCITLTIKANTLYSDSRAVENGTDSYNENTISKLDCFFYPLNSTDTEALYHTTINVPDGAQKSSNEGYSVSVTFDVPNSVKKKLFTDNTKCSIYVIANSKEKYSNASVASLKGSTISSDFSDCTKKQASFIMDGESTIELSNNALLGNVYLDRAACKFNFTVTKVENTITDHDVVYTSNPQSMSVKLRNGVNSSHLDYAASPYELTHDDYFDSNDYQTLTKYSANFASKDPYYSYPYAWDNTKKTVKPYFLLVVPWKAGNSGIYVNYYYSVQANSLTYSLLKNHYYQIAVTVGVLGSLDPDNPFDLTLNAKVSVGEWQSQEASLDIFNNKYLMVDGNYFVLNNIDKMTVSYTTSTQIKILSQTTTEESLVGDSPVETKIADACSIDKMKRVVIFNHKLNNDTENTTNYDHSMIKSVITICHEDNENYQETITFIQYPVLYIYADLNSDYHSNNHNAHNGYVFVNSVNNNDHYGSMYGGVTGLTGGNKNPNMYVISISALNSDSKYVIGDPRVSVIDNLQNPDWKDGKDYITNNDRKLQYYYPTDDSDHTRNMIAPKFRIASSYGVTQPLNLEYAKRRCASYQEDGLPAGRWRLPTRAELEYMVRLSAQKKIPVLLSYDTQYWSAHGSLTPKNNGTVQEGSETGYVYIRCVYDQWYWGDERIANRNAFTWGDKVK